MLLVVHDSHSTMDHQATKRLPHDQQAPATPPPPAPEKRKYPPGYRFMPTDAELIVEYLQKKIANEALPIDEIKETYLRHVNPMVLTARFPKLGDNAWYFFTPRDRKYPNGERPDRASDSGYWKATGSDKHVTVGDATVGFRKSLVFYEGKPQKGRKTKWIIHEFRSNGASRKKRSANDMRLDDWVICRMYEKSTRQTNKSKNGHAKEQTDAVDEIPLQASSDDYGEIGEATASVTYQENLPIFSAENPHSDCNYFPEPIMFNPDWPSVQDLLHDPQNGYFQSYSLEGIVSPIEQVFNNDFGNPYLSDEPLGFQQQQPNASSSSWSSNEVSQLPDSQNNTNNTTNKTTTTNNNKTNTTTNNNTTNSQNDTKQEDQKRFRRH